MGRAKLDLELIPKEKSRRSTYSKRKEGLKKKIKELSTLCAVDACMVLYGLKQGRRKVEPEIWPEGHDETRRIIHRYHQVDKNVRGKRSLDLLDICNDRKKKADSELKKLRVKNGSLLWNDRLNSLTLDQFRQLKHTLDFKKEEINAKIAFMKGQGNFSDGLTGVLVNTNEMQLQVPWHMSSSTGGNNLYGASTWREDDMVFQPPGPPRRYVLPSEHYYPSDHPTMVSADKLNMINNQLMLRNGIDYECNNGGSISNFSDPTVNNLPFHYEPMVMQSDFTNLRSSTFCKQPYLMPTRASSSLIDYQSSIMLQPSQMSVGSSQMPNQPLNYESVDVQDIMINNYKMVRFFQG